MSTKTVQSKAQQQQGKLSSATTALSATRGKRKLNFSTSSDHQFFRGKKLFLDLPGYNKIDQIEYELTQRGGTVERRFHSGVKYLITNRPSGGRGTGSQLDSPSTPSPNTPRGGLRSASKFSPCAESPTGVTPLADNPVSSRAAMMLAASKGKKKSTDLRALAENWGCKVLSLSELLKELRKLKPLPKKEESSKKKAPVEKVRKLRQPFLKAEDLSYSYRPLVYETRQWPRPDINCSPKGCPFDPPRQGRGHHHTSPKEGAAIGEAPKDASSPEAAHDDRRRPGYCECCSVRYGDLNMHLKSAKHLEYAHNDTNFTSLDDIIAKGKTLGEFVAAVRANKRPPSTPPRRSSPRKTSSPLRGKSAVRPFSPKRARVSPVKSPRRSSPTQTKDIVLDKTGVILSPKRGQLCVTPVKDSAALTPTLVEKKKRVNQDYTPGFNTPPKSTSRKTGGSRIDPVTRALLQNSARVNSRLRPQKKETSRPDTTAQTPTKQEQHDPDVVPETPEKVSPKVNPRLANFQTLVDRVIAKATALSKASVKQRRILRSDLQALVDEVTRYSPTSPGRSTSITPTVSPTVGVRKSPRLVERELLRFRPSVSAKTEKVTCVMSMNSDSLIVSYDLSRIYPGHKRRSAAVTKQSLITPTGRRGRRSESNTPEIEFQGVPLSKRRRARTNLLFSEESPLAGIQMGSASGDESFYGFSPNTVIQALPDFESPSISGVRRSPRKSPKLSVDNIALKLAAQAFGENGQSARKRGLELSEDDLNDPQLSPPPSKRRRLSADPPSSSPTLRPRRRRSPRLVSRKLRSSSCD